MDELIDILDDQGNLTGRNCLKSVAHKKGLYHATVHIWFYTPDGNILLQQRSASKKIYPLLYAKASVSVPVALDNADL